MDHLFKALDEHIAHQEWLIKCERNARDALEKENEQLRASKAETDSNLYKLQQRLGTITTMCESLSPTLSKQQWDDLQAVLNAKS